MADHIYRSVQMEYDLINKINDRVNERFNGDVPPDIQKRIAAETQHIIDGGHGTLFAAVASLAEFSADHGYPVGVRGLIGNLYVAHLLGIAVNDPMKLGLRYEGFLGLDGNHAQPVTLNAASEVLNDLRAHLRKILPDCDVLFGPGIPRWKIIIVPRASGVYDPGNEYSTLTLCPHELMTLGGEAGRRPAGADDFSEALILGAYRGDVAGIPVLDDLDDFRELANLLEPRSFSDLVKVMGLSLAGKLQFQAYRTPLLPDRFDHLVGTREDIYDICVRHGIGKDEAFRIMEQAVRGKLTREHRAMLADHGVSNAFLEVLDAAEYLYPRGQMADYMYWALTVLARRCRAYRA